MSGKPIERAAVTSSPSLEAYLRDRVEELLRTAPAERLEGLYPAIMRDVERTLLETVLVHVDGSRQDAARILGLHRNTLRNRLRVNGLDAAGARS